MHHKLELQNLILLLTLVMLQCKLEKDWYMCVNVKTLSMSWNTNTTLQLMCRVHILLTNDQKWHKTLYVKLELDIKLGINRCITH